MLEAMEDLYPSDGLDQRIATSRRDGYWPFIRDGYDPPSEFVYGEFDMTFFFQVVEKAMEVIRNSDEPDQSPTTKTASDWVFTDLGSGTGRLVLTAAGFYPWRLCRGIELLQGIHEQALQKLESCVERGDGDGDARMQDKDRPMSWPEEAKNFVPTESGLWLGSGSSTIASMAPNDNTDDDNHDHDENNTSSPTTTTTTTTTATSPTKYSLLHRPTLQRLPLAPIEFHCGSFTDPYQYFGDTTILFCFSSCLPLTTRHELAHAIGRQCRPGTMVLTTEYPLPLSGTIDPCPQDPSLPYGDFEFELLESITGINESTGGSSTVYLHQLKVSVGDGLPRTRPIPSLADRAYQAVMHVEETNDPTAFVRRVANDMIFAGFPDHWIPNKKRR